MESKRFTTFVQNKLKLRFDINRLEPPCLLKTRRNIDGTVFSFSLPRSLCRWRLETLEEVEKEHWVMLAALTLSQRLPDDTVDERVFLTNPSLVKHFQHLIRSYIAPGTLEAPDGR